MMQSKYPTLNRHLVRYIDIRLCYNLYICVFFLILATKVESPPTKKAKTETNDKVHQKRKSPSGREKRKSENEVTVEVSILLESQYVVLLILATSVH